MDVSVGSNTNTLLSFGEVDDSLDVNFMFMSKRVADEISEPLLFWSLLSLLAIGCDLRHGIIAAWVEGLPLFGVR